MQINFKKKLLDTVKCVATCGAIEIQRVDIRNSSATRISFLTYLESAIAYAVLNYLAAAIKLPKHKNS